MRASAAPLSEAVLLLAGLVAAAVVASAFLFGAALLGSSVKSEGAKVSRLVAARISFVDYYVNESTGCHVVFLKNVGSVSLGGLDRATVTLGNDSLVYLLSYAGYNLSQPGPGNWSYVDLEHPDGVWEPGETVKLVLCPPASLAGPFKLNLVLPDGVSFSVRYGG